MALSFLLALLGGLLLPELPVAREKTRQAICVKNLKQIGMGIMMYAADHGDWLPQTDTPWGKTWYQQVASYVGVDLTKFPQAAVFRCPSEKAAENNVNYAYSVFAGSFTSETPFQPIKITQVINPAGKIVVTDSSAPENLGTGNWGSFYKSCYAPGNGTAFAAACLPRRHSGGPNILYLDGHVEWKLREKVSASEFNTTGKFQ